MVNRRKALRLPFARVEMNEVVASPLQIPIPANPFSQLSRCRRTAKLNYETQSDPTTRKATRGEEGGDTHMKLLTKELKEKIPALYSQEHEKDPMVICKFFDPTGSWSWFVIEGEEKEYDYGMDFLFFGYVVGFDSELGYFTLNQLETAKQGMKGLQSLPIERDLYFMPRRLSEVKNKIQE